MAKFLRASVLLLSLALLAAAMPATAYGANGAYDTDGDGLIEISYLEQLDAMRHDLTCAYGETYNVQGGFITCGEGLSAGLHGIDGDGIIYGDSATAAYAAAFPVSGEQPVCENECHGYELTRDLDFKDPDSYASASVNPAWTGGEGWQPLPDFHAYFEGNGHTIANLFINRPDYQGNYYSNAVGLFEEVDSGHIRSVGLENVQVHGGTGPVGGMAGHLVAICGAGTIEAPVVVHGDTSVPSVRSITPNQCLVPIGEEYRHPPGASITDSYVTGSVSGEIPGGELPLSVGGLVGRAYGAVRNPSGHPDYYSLGQLPLQITGSHFSGTVLGREMEVAVGGLVGEYRVSFQVLDADVVENSYAEGSVSVKGDLGMAGGLVGESGARIENSYASATVTAASGALNLVSYAGGVAGTSAFKIINSYAVGNVKGTGFAAGLVAFNLGIIRDSHATGDVSGLTAGGLVATNSGTVSRSNATGAVSGQRQENSTFGGTAGGLVGVGVPVTQTPTQKILEIDNHSRIINSYATGAVTGTGIQGIGGLIGQQCAACEIISSYATGDVTSNHIFVGGLAGINDGAIIGSYAAGNVTGNQMVGGLVGSNQSDRGIVSSSYATGNVTGVGLVGGLAGESFGFINFSYSVGSVSSTGGYDIGGLVGWHVPGPQDIYDPNTGQVTGSYEPTITASYWDTQTTGQAAGVGQGAVQGAAGKTTAELQAPTGYTGIYAEWLADLDNADGDDDPTTGMDDIWDFRDSSQYPALKADFNGDGVATWQEFGNQTIEAQPAGEAASQTASAATPEPGAAPQHTTAAVAPGATASASQSAEEREGTAVSATAERAAATSDGAAAATPEPGAAAESGGGACGTPPEDTPPGATAGSLLLLLAPLAMIGGLKWQARRRRDGNNADSATNRH